MAPSKDPIKLVEDAVVRHQERVLKFYKTIWKQVKSLLTPLQKFLKDLLSAAKDLIKTVGKKVINHLTSTIRRIINFLAPIEKLLKDVIQLGKRILATIRKETDKIKVIRFLKTVVRKYVEFIKKVASLVFDLWKEIGILDAAVAVFDTFSTVLSFIFNWISALIKGLLSTVKKIRTILNKAVKWLIKEQKDAIRLVKDVGKLKVP